MRKIFFLILALGFFSLTAQAELPSLFGVGPVSMGMGANAIHQGTYTPYQAYGAPAALAFIKKATVSAGFLNFDPSLKPFGTLVLNSSGTRGEFSGAGVFEGSGQLLGFAFPLGNKERPFTFAGAFYVPSSTLIRVSGNPVNYPFYPLYTDISRNLFFVLGAGYEIFDAWALGFNLRSTNKSIAEYQLRSDSQINYSATAVEAKSQSRFSFSLLYNHERKNPENPYSIGLMYRAKSGLETKLTADISAFVPVEGQLISLPSYTPAEWVVMGTKRFSDWVLSTELSYVEWSSYVSPYGSGNINFYVIGSTRKEANFKNIFVPRLGLEKTSKQSSKVLKSLKYRAGYLYHPSPVPDQKEDSNFVDSNRHLMSLGLGFGFKNPWKEEDQIDLDLFAQYNLVADRKVTKNSMTKVGAPGYTSGGHILVYGLGGTIRF